ncbi:hypothetical protein [Ectobacillus panaciterrae]|uniref:hypothetical protein n=1 Tax=Ectobacillus panaciterrae TaxID=363872 RepID=UPI00041F10D9|nr:hypothetical protein [Ectobacillus panaciterrae]
MEPKKPGNEKMPDFHELEDRMIAEPSNQPTLVIKTNLDPKNATEDNPYYQNNSDKNSKQLREFFEET